MQLQTVPTLKSRSRPSHRPSGLLYLSRSSSFSIHPHNFHHLGRLLLSALLFPLHFFSSVSVITSICFLRQPTLSLPLAHFPPLIPAAHVRELFPTSSSSHFSSELLHADKHGLQSPLTPSTPHPLSQHPTTPSFSPVPVCPWHKCICSIPPANRLAGCYQRQGDGDNGFHHIFPLPQIKMGWVT